MHRIINNFANKDLVCVALITLFIAVNLPVVQAKDYKVEVLLFENLEAHSAFESQHYREPGVRETDAETWFIEPSMLLDEATAIETSANYKMLRYFSWGQESLPLSESAAFNVLEQQINGWIKIYANELLFANLDLDFNGYRMDQKRRLKLDEKHYFDHPKFGVLLQVSRLEKEQIKAAISE